MNDILQRLVGKTVSGWELGLGFAVLSFDDGACLVRIDAQPNEAGNPGVPDVSVTVVEVEKTG